MRNRFVLLLFLFFSYSISSFSQNNNNSPDTIDINGAIFIKVDKEASFPGGDKAWRLFLEKHIMNFNPADNSAPISHYTVIVQFVVDKDGSVTDIKPLTKEGYGMEQEVIRVIQNSGKWEPAMLNDKPVRAYRKQPVSFIVEEEGTRFISKEPFVLYDSTINQIAIHVDKIKDKNLGADISKGNIISNGDGTFNVKVNTPGERVIIVVYDTKKNNKLLGSASFSVRSLSEMAKH